VRFGDFDLLEDEGQILEIELNGHGHLPNTDAGGISRPGDGSRAPCARGIIEVAAAFHPPHELAGVKKHLTKREKLSGEGFSFMYEWWIGDPRTCSPILCEASNFAPHLCLYILKISNQIIKVIR
jgi:hypothetical protein